MGWEHINLTGDYVWRTPAKDQEGKFSHCDISAGLTCFIVRFVRRPRVGDGQGQRVEQPLGSVSVWVSARDSMLKRYEVAAFGSRAVNIVPSSLDE